MPEASTTQVHSDLRSIIARMKSAGLAGIAPVREIDSLVTAFTPDDTDIGPDFVRLLAAVVRRQLEKLLDDTRRALVLVSALDNPETHRHAAAAFEIGVDAQATPPARAAQLLLDLASGDSLHIRDARTQSLRILETMRSALGCDSDEEDAGLINEDAETKECYEHALDVARSIPWLRDCVARYDALAEEYEGTIPASEQAKEGGER